MKVKKLRELLDSLNEDSNLLFQVELPKRGRWEDGRAQMILGRLRFVDKFTEQGEPDAVCYSFACRLENF